MTILQAGWGILKPLRLSMNGKGSWRSIQNRHDVNMVYKELNLNSRL
jgi:hypothetical protein